jgi:hypothetical protein
MAIFITHVELHKKEGRTITELEYEILHREMQINGFKKNILKNPVAGKFLTAEYFFVENCPVEIIEMLALEACNKAMRKSTNIKEYIINTTEKTNNLVNFKIHHTA